MAYQREVRLGLVLYGGVSLAVYENGVAQELHRAIRGDGVYGLVKELIDSDIVVDIISGTSAGGVNGIMLAYALANKRQFAPSAELWRNQGDIQELLRKEKDAVSTSILNSVYYQEKLEECFATKLAPDPSAPEIEELDLFITGTDANGDIYTVYDDRGHPIDVKNHRALFKLSYRKGDRKNDLGSARPADLAKLARITSCFPAAFEPVKIGAEERLFFRWGKLRKPGVYLDGGILNNKPFSSTIDAIARRTANREVERFLIYVEPDPEVFQEGAPSAAPHSPSVAEAAASSLLSIPRYQSIAADLEASEAHNERAQRIGEMLEAMPEAADAGWDCLDRAEVWSSGAGEAYSAARLIQLRDSAVASILNDAAGRGYIRSLPDRRSGRILVESFNYWPGKPEATLAQYDVFFRMRRAAHLSQALMRRTKAGKPVPQPHWDLVNHYFKLYEITEWAMIGWLNQWNYNWRKLGPDHPELETQPDEERQRTLAGISAEVWGEVEGRLKLLLQSEVAVPEELTAQARSTYYDQLSKHLEVNAAPAAAKPGNLLHAIDDSFKAALKNLQDGETARLLRNEFCRFLEVDRQLAPIQVAAGFASTSTMRLVRFSPLDAQRGLSKGKVSEKVCGSALGAFGGFFKKSWRANDIMMGRLDAACLLIECLLTKERLAALPAGRNVTAEQLEKWFPTIGGSAAALADTIDSYLAAPREATPAAWNGLVDAIAIACHNEIVQEEWPRVIECAIEQEYAWGQYSRNQKSPAEPFDRKNLAWKRAKARPDQVLVAAAANALKSGQIPPFTPGAVAGRAFLEEVPEPVLQELGFLSTIRIGKSLLESIPNPEIHKKVEGSRIYTWLFGFTAPLLYRWARMRRTKPDSVIVLNTAVPVACLAALLVEAALGIFGPDLTPRLWAGLVAPPAVVLLLWGLWFRK